MTEQTLIKLPFKDYEGNNLRLDFDEKYGGATREVFKNEKKYNWQVTKK